MDADAAGAEQVSGDAALGARGSGVLSRGRFDGLWRFEEAGGCVAGRFQARFDLWSK